ncbi:MAG: hypothetical protein H0V36_07760 [Chloroflexi bacterium]|nr:hypothetical protein [Chloroflexota bacterium]
MGRRAQHAPKLATIGFCLIFVLVGVLGTFAHLIPAIAGFSGELIGIWSFIVATVVILAGIFFEGI